MSSPERRATACPSAVIFSTSQFTVFLVWQKIIACITAMFDNNMPFIAFRHLSDGDDSVYVCYRPVFRLWSRAVHPHLKGSCQIFFQDKREEEGKVKTCLMLSKLSSSLLSLMVTGLDTMFSAKSITACTVGSSLGCNLFKLPHSMYNIEYQWRGVKKYQPGHK